MLLIWLMNLTYYSILRNDIGAPLHRYSIGKMLWVKKKISIFNMKTGKNLRHWTRASSPNRIQSRNFSNKSCRSRLSKVRGKFRRICPRLSFAFLRMASVYVESSSAFAHGHLLHFSMVCAIGSILKGTKFETPFAIPHTVGLIRPIGPTVSLYGANSNMYVPARVCSEYYFFSHSVPSCQRHDSNLLGPYREYSTSQLLRNLG